MGGAGERGIAGGAVAAAVGALFALFALLAVPLAMNTGMAAAQELQGIRGAAAVEDANPAPHIGPAPPERRRIRNYPEQPPLIPHSIDNYEISLRANQCLSCHSRRRTAASGAPMPSVTHFMDRDLQVLSEVSAGRYFCTQCHVGQSAAVPPVRNTFIDAADLGGE